MDVNPRNPLLPLAPREGGYYYPWKWCSVGVETAVFEGGKEGGSSSSSPFSNVSTYPEYTDNCKRSLGYSGMDDGRSPSGGADTLKGGN